MKRLLPLTVVLVAAAIAALAVNLLLVDYASGREDPVGNLSPRAELPAPSTIERRQPATTTNRDPTTTDDDDRVETEQTATEDDDDSSGRGRGRNRGRGGDGSDDDD